jgi:Kelch motif
MAAAHAGVVYHLGGYLVALEQPTDRALALVDGTWKDLAPMPEPRAAGAAEFVRGKLYVVGGVSPDGVVDDILIYDPKADEWTSGPGPSIAREHLTLVRRGRYLYAIGGRQLTYETTMTSVERFDPRTRRWKTMPSVPFPVAGHVSAVTRSGLMVVAGGETAAGPLAATVAFDFSRRRWVALPALDPARTGFGAAAFGDRFFVFGGAGADPGYYDLTESLDLGGIASPP